VPQPAVLIHALFLEKVAPFTRKTGAAKSRKQGFQWLLKRHNSAQNSNGGSGKSTLSCPEFNASQGFSGKGLGKIFEFLLSSGPTQIQPQPTDSR
jgi:hypothetical protein